MVFPSETEKKVSKTRTFRGFFSLVFSPDPENVVLSSLPLFSRPTPSPSAPPRFWTLEMRAGRQDGEEKKKKNRNFVYDMKGITPKKGPPGRYMSGFPFTSRQRVRARSPAVPVSGALVVLPLKCHLVESFV